MPVLFLYYTEGLRKLTNLNWLKNTLMAKETSRQSLGYWGETKAAEYLAKSGYRLVDRNVRTDYGEIDLVMQTADVLVFVEVKTRRSQRYGKPESAITATKLQHMVQSSQAYMQEHPEFSQDWRIDVVSVYVKPGNLPTFTHFENVTL